MGTLHATAEAVKDLLEATGFSKRFEPRLAYDTELALEDLDTLHVDVVAAALACQADSRASLRYEVQVDVAVRYRFGQDETDGLDGSIETDEVEPYLDLLEEIAETLADPDNRALSNKTTAVWIANELRAPWVPEHLRTLRQYTGILRATYVVAKDL